MISKSHGYAFLIAAALLLAAPLARAQQAMPVPGDPGQTVTAPDQLDLIAVGTVTDIIKPDLIRLENGVSYRLDQIRVPVTYNAIATDFLREAILDKKIGVYAVKKAKEGAADSYGNPYGHVVMEDGTWVQKEMVGRGMAWAYSTETNRLLVKELRRYEDAARMQKVGFWSDPDYAIKDRTNIRKYLNSYQIYQGTIAHLVPNYEALTMVCDYDAKRNPIFSFAIPKNRMINFTSGKHTFMPNAWTGAIVRVRGWVSRGENGLPVIQVTHPEQMDFIDPKTGLPTTGLVLTHK